MPTKVQSIVSVKKEEMVTVGRVIIPTLRYMTIAIMSHWQVKYVEPMGENQYNLISNIKRQDTREAERAGLKIFL